MSSELELIQDNIEEYVNDDSKIVTCKWLSLTLNLNINVAKQALYTYVQHQRNKGGNDDVNVTYFVAGLGKTKAGDPIHKCIVVPESDLDAVKSTLQPVTSCHVYSVQRARLKDYTALYQTDYDIIKQNLDNSASHGSIKCPWATVRTDKPVNVKADVKQKSPIKKEADNSSKPSQGHGDVKTDKPVAMATSGKAKKPEPKGSIANMFGSTGKKAQASAGNDKEQKTEDTAKSKPAPQKKGVAAFFGKQSSSKPEARAAKNAPGKANKESAAPKAKKAREDVSDEEEPLKKKRRRIKTDLFDSSDEENGEEEEEEKAEMEEQMAVSEDEEPKEEPVEDEEEKKDDKNEPPKEEVDRGKKKEEVETKIVTGPGGRKRRRTRKLVPKQYVDEEGFMVTEKVWESDSTDADEDEVAEEERKKKEEEEKKKKTQSSNTKPSNAGAKGDSTGKAAPKKSSASPQKGIQTSLMSFFKKK